MTTEYYEIGSIVANTNTGSLGLVLQTRDNYGALSSYVLMDNTRKWLRNEWLEIKIEYTK
jgi:hypothetical protein